MSDVSYIMLSVEDPNTCIRISAPPENLSKGQYRFPIKNLKFYASRRNSRGDAVGVLILHEEVYARWVKEWSPLPGYETAESCAKKLVARPGIYLGCPVEGCTFMTKDIAEYLTHRKKHTAAIISQFDAEELREMLMEETEDA